MKKYIYQLLCSLFIGGTMVACGTPEEIAEVPESYTGYYVKKYLKK